MQTAAKLGIQLTPVTGMTTRFMVEFEDGSAELFNAWDEAMAAGSFDTATE